MKQIRTVLLTACICFVFASFAQAKAEVVRYPARVVKVWDGDTVHVKRGQKRVKIRLMGIDCPEKKQPYGLKSRNALAKLVFKKTVTVEDHGQDFFKRTLARLHLDGVNINRQLVKMGACWAYPKYAKDKMLFKLQKQAEKDKCGLWAGKNPIAPWKFRKLKKQKSL